MRRAPSAKQSGCNRILRVHTLRWRRCCVSLVIPQGLQLRVGQGRRSEEKKTICKRRPSPQIPVGDCSTWETWKERSPNFVPRSSWSPLTLLPTINWASHYSKRVRKLRRRKNFKRRQSWIRASGRPLRSLRAVAFFAKENPYCRRPSRHFEKIAIVSNKLRSYSCALFFRPVHRFSYLLIESLRHFISERPIDTALDKWNQQD